MYISSLYTILRIRGPFYVFLMWLVTDLLEFEAICTMTNLKKKRVYLMKIWLNFFLIKQINKIVLGLHVT